MSCVFNKETCLKSIKWNRTDIPYIWNPTNSSYKNCVLGTVVGNFVVQSHHNYINADFTVNQR